MKMTREEYIARMNSEDDWAPGWDAIEEELNRLYQAGNRLIMGLRSMQELCSAEIIILTVIRSMIQEKGYQHIVTFGMSELYTDEDAFERRVQPVGL